MNERIAAGLVLALGVAGACGGKPEPKAPVEEPQVEEGPKRTGPTPQVSQELGSIDQRAVEATFAKLQGPLEKCHTQGRGRVEYLAGDVKVFLRIDTAGKVRYGHFEESTIGDSDTERCILDVFSGARWPQPEGGEAEVRHGFGWGGGGEREPTPWGPEKVLKALGDSKDVKKELDRCKSGVTGDFVVTAYVEPDGKHGKFHAIGVVPPNKEAHEKVGCVVDALRPLKLPSPGSYAAKVTFAL